MALADTLGAICAFLEPAARPPAPHHRVEDELLRPGAQRHIEAVTHALHVGRRTIVLQTDVRDATGGGSQLVVQTQAVLVD